MHKNLRPTVRTPRLASKPLGQIRSELHPVKIPVRRNLVNMQKLLSCSGSRNLMITTVNIVPEFLSLILFQTPSMTKGAVGFHSTSCTPTQKARVLYTSRDQVMLGWPMGGGAMSGPEEGEGSPATTMTNTGTSEHVSIRHPRLQPRSAKKK